MTVWFKKGFFTGQYIGVIEHNGERILVQPTDTIEQIEHRVNKLTQEVK